MAEEKAKLGRPVIYSKELADTICDRIAKGESLRKICLDESMPARKTIHLWLLDKEKEDFLHHYNVASNIRADELFDELQDIADNEEGDVQRDRLRVDTRKWYLSKVLPKKFGDKLDVTTDGEKINKVSIEIINGTKTQSVGDIPEELSV